MRLGPWGTFVFRTTVVGLLVAATFGMAQEGPPSGKVSMESKSVARGIGVSWGDGKLTYQGKERVFSVDGLTISTTSATLDTSTDTVSTNSVVTTTSGM